MDVLGAHMLIFLRGIRSRGLEPGIDIKLNRKDLQACIRLQIDREGAQFRGLTSLLEQVEIDKGEPPTSFELLSLLLNRVENMVFNPLHQKVYQDMSRPLSEYFISSSHNSYVEGHQLFGAASTEQIIAVLISGARVIELDCYDGMCSGIKCPVIKHGWTPMLPVSFADTINVIKQYAFVASKFPLILSLENHCTPRMQTVQANILKESLGQLLFAPPLRETQTSCWKLFLSPLQLQGKVILRQKFRTGSAECSNATIHYGCNTLAKVEKEQPHEVLPRLISANPRAKLAWLYSLCIPKNTNSSSDKLLSFIYIHNIKVKEKTIKENANLKTAISCSWNEGKMNKNLKNSCVREKIIKFTQSRIMRVYPAYWRFDSSNFAPQNNWYAGVQMVALNFQTYDRHMAYNNARFADNGNCGYVLKPKWMSNRGSPGFPNAVVKAPCILKITLFAIWFPYKSLTQQADRFEYTAKPYLAEAEFCYPLEHECLAVNLTVDRICLDSGKPIQARFSSPPASFLKSGLQNSTPLNSSVSFKSLDADGILLERHDVVPLPVMTCASIKSEDRSGAQRYPLMLPKHHAEIFPHHSSHETEKNDGCGNRAEQSSQSPNINCVWIWKNKPVTFFTKVQKNGDDLAILHFELVKLHKQRKMLCGEYTISSVNIRNGFRVIPVRNPQTGEAMEDSYLFACFEFI